MSEQTLQADKERLLADVRSVLNSTEELLAAAGDEGGEKTQELKAKVAANLKLAKARLVEAEHAAVEKARAAARATDQYVHENPWKSIGVAAAGAFLLGLLVSRR
ncbi:ElaB/YqjD/DUF883 family membrane-anchored ribosome-binding protein [Crenobacter luteus]|uniref:DUF883 domain-containing protein n=1 Tax=Crenobacter luteus TaxID=1452487 RepID=A0A163CLW9_9NEIS|nr:DUF883 family protein [Crenobacter luteus]KZE32746.1 hypothetical protein AVW16_10175 [Crenobacter luteus]TCP12637.1 ElaB/YqjD/DUF883 family membrane-anchored ribosome-binding protein [Crenobacter luteus]